MISQVPITTSTIGRILENKGKTRKKKKLSVLVMTDAKPIFQIVPD
jgi:hypothetical protein